MQEGAGGTAGEVIAQRIRSMAAAEQVRITQHAQQEMAEESVRLDEVLEALSSGHVVEDYPEHRRGPCCLVHGVTGTGRDLHVVCTSARPVLVIITVYEPRPPRWVTPAQRGRKP